MIHIYNGQLGHSSDVLIVAHEHGSLVGQDMCHANLAHVLESVKVVVISVVCCVAGIHR